MSTPKQLYVEIQLTQGKVALVDADDSDQICGHKWYALKAYKNIFYAARKIRIEGRAVTVLMHRELMELAFGDGREVDHANRDSLDNRRANLRICTSSQNKANRIIKSVSGRKGVSWNAERAKWQATISIRGKSTFIGRYDSLDDAGKAYEDAAHAEFGEFART